jgi:hypothetical protein
MFTKKCEFQKIPRVYPTLVPTHNHPQNVLYIYIKFYKYIYIYIGGRKGRVNPRLFVKI